MRVLSKLKTAIAYDAGKPGGHTVTLKPGVNVVSEQDKAVLDADSFFKKHVDKGHLAALPDEAPAPAAVAPVAAPAAPAAVAPVAAPAAPAVDPRARLTGESNNAYKARMKALDAAEAAAKPSNLSPDDQAMVDNYKALTTDEARDGYKAMLDDRQRDILAQATQEGG